MKRYGVLFYFILFLTNMYWKNVFKQQFVDHVHCSGLFIFLRQLSLPLVIQAIHIFSL